ncbi:MAG: hypothetical protein WCD24_24820 [Serratia inhibens]|uniref:hypothetical protein n=1 Tax=Serratia inhibens TaxID=2338073 RepID=UPI003C7D22A5
MAVKISVLNIVSKELEGNKQVVPHTPSDLFGKDDLDTVYYDPDTNRITIFLCAFHTGPDQREPNKFNYSLLPDVPEMESHVDYQGPSYYQDKLVSFTPLPGNHDYSFMSFAVLNIAEHPGKPPMYVTMPWAGVKFSFDGK